MDAAFKKKERKKKTNPERSKENSGDEIFKILSSASKQSEAGEAKQSDSDSKAGASQAGVNQAKQISQQEINERLNMLMNM